MKKLIALSCIALLAACTQPHKHEKHNPDVHHKNPALMQAMKECHSTLKDKKDMPTFEQCLKEKGFEKPANHPKMKGKYKHKNPKFAKAVKECHKGVKSVEDSAKFEACLKEKGFEKPANHPKVGSYH
ncbi:hypothetical protein [Mannheimia sp. E16BA]|uniref:hypothetical protein n=1 Tax=Mannheimia sp. E16BA TaxID=3278707 RepID=UPI00359E5F08